MYLKGSETQTRFGPSVQALPHDGINKDLPKGQGVGLLILSEMINSDSKKLRSKKAVWPCCYRYGGFGRCQDECGIVSV